MEETTLTNILSLYGDKIIDIYRKKLAETDSNASGKLGNTMSFFVDYNDGSYELCLRMQDYWKWLEEGRKPGSFPNITSLKKWVEVKPIIPRMVNGKLPTLESLTYLIGRKIEEKGVEGKHLLSNTLEETEKMNLIEQEVDKRIDNEITLIFNTLK